jgi:hypothetical protein
MHNADMAMKITNLMECSLHECVFTSFSSIISTLYGLVVCFLSTLFIELCFLEYAREDAFWSQNRQN